MIDIEKLFSLIAYAEHSRSGNGSLFTVLFCRHISINCHSHYTLFPPFKNTSHFCVSLK